MSTIGSHRTHQSKMMPETVAGSGPSYLLVSFTSERWVCLRPPPAERPAEKQILDNLWLGIPALAGLVGAINSMISGLIAVIGRREQGASIFIAAAASTLIVLFVALTLIFG